MTWFLGAIEACPIKICCDIWYISLSVKPRVYLIFLLQFHSKFHCPQYPDACPGKCCIFFLEVLFLIFHLVFMIVYLKCVRCRLSVDSKVLCMLIKLLCSGISLITTQDCLYCTWKVVRWPFMWRNSLFVLFNHWMYYINLGRKMPAVWIQVLFRSDRWLPLNIMAGCIHPKFFGPYHVAQEPLGARRWCLRASPCGGLVARAAARVPASLALNIMAWGDALSSSCSSAAAYTKLFNKYACWSIWEKICCVLGIQQ